MQSINEIEVCDGGRRPVDAELAHTNRVATMGQLSASIAHEINQPIAAAVTHAQAALRWLAADPPNLDETRRSLGDIVKVCHRAGDLVGRMRSFIRKAPPQRDGIEINETIREVISLTRGEVAKNDILIETRFAVDLPLVRGDRIQLQQVILNLIINAVEAMSGMTGGVRELHIATMAGEPSGVRVEVRDSGPGVAPANLRRMFEAFYTTKPGGLGMGLLICRSIIDAHGGRIWVSENTRRGAVFQFTLPAHPGSEPR